MPKLAIPEVVPTITYAELLINGSNYTVTDFNGVNITLEKSTTEISNVSAEIDITGPYKTCPLMNGFPPMITLLKSYNGRQYFFLMMNFLVLVATSFIYLQEVDKMENFYKRRVSIQKHQKRMIYLFASIPMTLSFAALIVFIAPRTVYVVHTFAATYFSFCIYGFSRMILDYFGGVKQTAKYLKHKSSTIDFKSLPLTLCCVCLPNPEAKVRYINIFRYAIIQVIPISIFITFIKPAIMVDSSFCADELGESAILSKKADLTKLIKVLSYMDLLSTMTAMNGLKALAKNTVAHLESFQAQQKAFIFTLSLLFFRIQPIILSFLTEQVGKHKPSQPYFSDQAYTIQFNAQLQLFEFLIISVVLRMVFASSWKLQIKSGRKTSVIEISEDSDSEDVGPPKTAKPGRVSALSPSELQRLSQISEKAIAKQAKTRDHRISVTSSACSDT